MYASPGTQWNNVRALNRTLAVVSPTIAVDVIWDKRTELLVSGLQYDTTGRTACSVTSSRLANPPMQGTTDPGTESFLTFLGFRYPPELSLPNRLDSLTNFLESTMDELPICTKIDGYLLICVCSGSQLLFLVTGNDTDRDFQSLKTQSTMTVEQYKYKLLSALKLHPTDPQFAVERLDSSLQILWSKEVKKGIQVKFGTLSLPVSESPMQNIQEVVEALANQVRQLNEQNSRVMEEHEKLRKIADAAVQFDNEISIHPELLNSLWVDEHIAATTYEPSREKPNSYRRCDHKCTCACAKLHQPGALCRIVDVVLLCRKRHAYDYEDYSLLICSPSFKIDLQTPRHHTTGHQCAFGC
ncbi:hypothetical protein CLF_105151 [Clonorchis sinensis]|uniref:Uncharacterized protein n=1 Tax=Clonorchis sinensis TaxID=79923 RepID=H2KR04_CLOSI|nr:hypothetical protein CLF_105151 [Clonorchis sinensis]